MAGRLYYFNARGRAEQMRLLLTVVGEDFEDFRFDHQEWLDYKQDMPFQQVPALETDEGIIAQSLAVQRYLAAKYGLACETLLEDARADMIAYSINDMRMPFRQIVMEKDEEKREQLRLKYDEEQLPCWLGYFENILMQNNGGNGYLVGNKLTWIDFTFVTYMDPDPYVKYCKVNFDLSKYPALLGHYERILSDTRVRKWFDARPYTDF